MLEIFDGLFETIAVKYAHRRIFIICDKKVLKLNSGRFEDFNVIPINAGEDDKNLKTVSDIYKKFVDLGIDRDSLVIGIGGGTICDITGFVASTFMRGIEFAFVPTTLLSLVDASMGGKNGVSFMEYKNLIGTFTQPSFIVHDLSFLQTLGGADVKSGLAEVIKHALIADRALYDFLKNNVNQVQELQPYCLERIIGDSVRIKMSIVENDEKEHGERRLLNFGHTLGHAIENVLKLSHGDAVASGMFFALKISRNLNFLQEQEYLSAVELLKKYGYEEIKIPGSKIKDVVSAMKNDKKKTDKDIRFVLLQEIGHAFVKDLGIKLLEGFL